MLVSPTQEHYMVIGESSKTIGKTTFTGCVEQAGNLAASEDSTDSIGKTSLFCGVSQIRKCYSIHFGSGNLIARHVI